MSLTTSIIGKPNEPGPYVLDENPRRSNKIKNDDFLDFIFTKEDSKVKSVLSFILDSIFVVPEQGRGNI